VLGRYIDLASPISDHPFNAKTVAWWLPMYGRLGTSLLDLTTRRTLALVNDSSWKSGASAEFPSLDFDGTDDYATLAVQPTSVTDDVYAEAVINPRVLPQNGGGTNGGTFVNVGENGGSAGGWSLSISGTSFGDPGSRLTILFPGVGWTNFTYSFATAGAWYHVVVGRAAGTWRAWINGVVDATTSTQSISAPAATTRLGARTDGTHTFNGRVGSARIAETAPTDAIAAGLYDQWRRGYPDLLRTYSRKSYLFFSPPTGESWVSAAFVDLP